MTIDKNKIHKTLKRYFPRVGAGTDLSVTPLRLRKNETSRDRKTEKAIWHGLSVGEAS